MCFSFPLDVCVNALVHLCCTVEMFNDQTKNFVKKDAFFET